MKINELMEIVHKSYPDETTRRYWSDIDRCPDNGTGDGFAEAVVTEVFETFDGKARDEAQFSTAADVLERAIEDIQMVWAELERRRCDIIAEGNVN